MRFAFFVLVALLGSRSYAADTCADITASCKAENRCVMIDNLVQAGKPTFSAASVEVVKKNLNEIMTVAMLNRIDPRALIGSILAANTINPSQADKIMSKMPSFIQAAMPKQGLFYGIGKISINAAMEVEISAYPKKWDPTASAGRSSSEVQKALNVDSTALMAAGKYVRYAQEVYAKNNWPIDEKPEVIATLYSMGKIEDRAAATVKAGREPRINDWGVLVGCNTDVIQKILAEAKSSKDSLSEGGCIYVPANAKVTDWKFKCMKADGTFKMDGGTAGAGAKSPSVQSSGTKQ